MVPAVTYLIEIAYVANGPTVNADLSIKIILKKIFTFLKKMPMNYMFILKMYLWFCLKIFLNTVPKCQWIIYLDEKKKNHEDLIIN